MNKCPSSGWHSAALKCDTCPQIVSSPFSSKLKVQISSLMTYKLVPTVRFPFGAEKVDLGKNKPSCPVTAFPEPGSYGVIFTIFLNPKSKNDYTIGNLMICRWKFTIQTREMELPWLRKVIFTESSFWAILQAFGGLGRLVESPLATKSSAFRWLRARISHRKPVKRRISLKKFRSSFFLSKLEVAGCFELV